MLGDDDSVLISDLRVRPYSTLTLHVPCGGPAPAVVGRGRGKEGEGDDKGYDENQKFDEFEGNKIKIINFDLPKSLPKSKTSSSSSSSRQIENFGFGQI